MNHIKPISILICALGGEGGGVLTQWLVDAARFCGFPVQATSIPGVAQRTGATTYYLEIYPELRKHLADAEIIFGLSPLPGQIDLLISSELLEAARQVSNGLSSKSKTTVISSTGRVLTTAEKMHLGDGRVDSKELIALIEQFSHSNYFVDMAHMTHQAKTIISSVMLGCMASSGLLPMSVESFREVIGDQTQSQKASLKGFNLGLESIQAQKQQLAYLNSVLKPGNDEFQAKSSSGGFCSSLSPEIKSQYPLELQGTLDLAYERIKSFQNQNYADLFLTRLNKIQGAEQTQTHSSYLVTQESIKRLTVLMCYEDLAQVALLKLSTERFNRVANEVNLGKHDLLKIYDHFKPGIEEMAAMLPLSIAKHLNSWAHARQSRGLAPLSLPIKLASHSMHGILMLKILSLFKFLRPKSSRFQDEQELIDKWVDAVCKGAMRSLELGLEIAKCANLIKGYGNTNARGRENFNHILEHLLNNPKFITAQDCAQAIYLARSTAMKDEAGKGFDLAMKGLGLPQRAPRYEPIRWMSKTEMSKLQSK